MKRREIRQKATELLDQGYPKQQAFEVLSAQDPGLRTKRVADVIRYLPTLQARERNRTVHLLLLAVIAIHAVLLLLHGLAGASPAGGSGVRYLRLVPFATILLGYSLYRWQGQVFVWVGWMNLLSVGRIMKAYPAWSAGGADPWQIALDVLPVVIGALCLFLAYRVFPKYGTQADPLIGEKRFVFPEEPGMGPM